MNQIYLDQLQCRHFNLPYFENSKTVCLDVKELLNSKIQGYDEHHTMFLTPLKKVWVEKTLGLTFGPGWYTVTSWSKRENNPTPTFEKTIEYNRVKTKALRKQIEQEIIY